MTPQIRTKTPHLSSDEMSELLATSTLAMQPAELDRPVSEANAHLVSCPACFAELNSLREALSVFGRASVAHADRVYSSLPRPVASIPVSPRSYPRALLWVAASTILMAGILPLEMRWQRDAKPAPAAPTAAVVHTTQSDEDLLADVDRELSAFVPPSMQSLADPTGDTAGQQTSVQNSTQGKD